MRKQRSASYANAGHARPASTPAPAGHSLTRNLTRNKEHNYEKAAQLDRHQRWPTSTGQRRPAMAMKYVIVAGRPGGAQHR